MYGGHGLHLSEEGKGDKGRVWQRPENRQGEEFRFCSGCDGKTLEDLERRRWHDATVLERSRDFCPESRL